MVENACFMTANHGLLRLSSFRFDPAGAHTPLHHDTIMLFPAQVVGRKRCRFISPLESPRLYNFNKVFSPIDIDAPELERDPLSSQVTVLEVIVESELGAFLVRSLRRWAC